MSEALGEWLTSDHPTKGRRMKYEDGDELCGSCGERIEDCNDMKEQDQ